MPIPGVIETFDRLKKLHDDKSADYSPEGDPFFNFNEAEHISTLFDGDRDKVFATMIGIKLARLAVLLNSKKAPVNESILDSFDDLMVYAAIWRADVEIILNTKRIKMRK